MRSNYPQIMRWLAVYEGGLVNHPRDPGGLTNRGVTQRVYDAFRRRNGQPKQSVRHLTDLEHDQIYLAQYWKPVRGDDLPSGIDASVFDMAVHSGASRAAKTLQAVLGVKVDGVIGEITIDACERAVRDGQVATVIVDYNKRRMAFLRRLSTFDVFGKGWTRRVVGDQPGAQVGDIGVVDRSIMLARRRDVIPSPTRPVEGKADDNDLRWVARLIEALADLFSRLFKKKGIA